MQNAEINDLQEKVLRLEQQLSVKADIPPEQETSCTQQETNYMQQETIDLKSKLQCKVLLLIIMLFVFFQLNFFHAFSDHLLAASFILYFGTLVQYTYLYNSWHSLECRMALIRFTDFQIIALVSPNFLLYLPVILVDRNTTQLHTVYAWFILIQVNQLC